MSECVTIYDACLLFVGTEISDEISEATDSIMITQMFDLPIQRGFQIAA